MTIRRWMNAPVEGLNWLIRQAVARGHLPQRVAPLPVISVGNITMGGTGKTPLVEALTRALMKLGAKPAILTRGYKRRGTRPVVLEGDPGDRWLEAGDEPSLLAKKLPGVPVVVDSNRLRGAAEAFARGATHALLDDGFQHWPLARTLDLVVVDAQDPLGEQAWRRENPQALRFASRLVCVGKAHEQEPARAILARYHHLPPFPVALRPEGFLWKGNLHPLSHLAERKLLAFAGIARPTRFFSTLLALGAQLVDTRAFPDHHRYRERELKDLLSQAMVHGAIPMTTEKDAVRLPNAMAAEVAVLQVSLVSLEEDFEVLVRPLFAIR